ncbi:MULTISPECIES: RDD family protein [unclassified Novosphingobium]|uniref:RDD family protein n=1 Tax=unclassified Novosphingobium TaxID=2644732 RepID=UPI00146B4AFB|nr:MULTISPECIES: RDD family protein [unclassified Novosphingobium]NMN05496.1 putative RDD family membrane protein YckC [Novosphingobium sp. SG919]NMN88145.1 putative RDD family membrane protein YckC [Novosphingobium sp. SG916]
MALLRRRRVRLRPGPDRRQRQVITPEGVPLPFTIGARGARAAALIIDYVLIVAAMAGLTYLVASLANAVHIKADERNPVGQALVVIWIVIMFLFRHIWFLYFELGPRGATPGKRIVGLRVAARDGGRLTTEAVVARNFLRDIELTLPMIFISTTLAMGEDASFAGWAGTAWFLIFVLFPFCNRDALRAGDVVAGTWVVEAGRDRLKAALSTGAGAQGHSTLTQTRYEFGEAELSVYGEYELQVLERVLRDDNAEAMADVAQAICTKIGWTNGRGDERAFLEAYYTQLRARLERGMRFGRRKADKHS